MYMAFIFYLVMDSTIFSPVTIATFEELTWYFKLGPEVEPQRSDADPVKPAVVSDTSYVAHVLNSHRPTICTALL